MDDAVMNFYGEMWDLMRPYFSPGISPEQAQKSADLLNERYPRLKLEVYVKEDTVGLRANFVQVNLDKLLDTIKTDAEKGPLIDTRHLDA